jgi:tetratricopeptide (TPR) repeat protein
MACSGITQIGRLPDPHRDLPSVAMIEGGPGWHIDGETLRPVITDESVFRTEHANDPAIEALVALWTDEPERALAMLDQLLAVEPANWRLRALRADAMRDVGNHQDAIADYHRLVCEHTGTSTEAVLVQHLGKAYFAAREYESAVTCFERALDLRLAAGADRRLVESSRAALQRARTGDRYR